LHSWFTPAAVHEADCLLVGDAAGLANPFTGEGLGYAVHSGLLAAEAIADHPDDPVEARREYTNRIAAAAVGYFEAAQHAARRYHLVWRMLSDSAGNDHPLIAKARRAILLPRAAGPVPARSAELGPATAFLVACDAVALSAVRERWPFLARLVASGEGLVQRELRLATLLLAGLSAEGARPGREMAAVGAAVELAGLSALVFVGNAPRPDGRPGVPWGLAATVLTADFLLAEASRLVADAAPRLARSFAEWLGDLTALRADRLAGEAGVPAAAVFGALFEFPARAGAWLGGCSDAVRRRLPVRRGPAGAARRADPSGDIVVRDARRPDVGRAGPAARPGTRSGGGGRVRPVGGHRGTHRRRAVRARSGHRPPGRGAGRVRHPGGAGVRRDRSGTDQHW
jgi:hypothetical protein